MTKYLNRIESVRALDGMIVEACYTSGQVVRVDMTDVVDRYEVFAPLVDRAVFEQVTVEEWGSGIEWTADASIGAERLLEMALEQAGRTDAVAFRQWQWRNALSLTDAANALGMTRRTVSQYRTGARPVPRTVLLALIGWEVEQQVSGQRSTPSATDARGAA